MSDKNASELLGSIAEQMTKLKEVLDKTQGITDDDRAEYGALLARYQGFVDENLQLEPGKSKNPTEEPNLIGVPDHCGIDGEPTL